MRQEGVYCRDGVTRGDLLNANAVCLMEELLKE